MADILFISEQTLKDKSVIHDNVDVKTIRPIIIDCQDIYIQEIIGTGIFEELKTQISAVSVSSHADNKKLLDLYVIPCLIAWIKFEAPIELTYKFTAKRIGKKSSEDLESISLEEIQTLMSGYKDKAEWRSQRLTDFLIENRSKYPLYDNPGSGYDVIRPKKNNFTCGMYLGEGKSKKQPGKYS